MAIDAAEAAERGGKPRGNRAPTVYAQGGKTFARMRGSLIDGLEAYATRLGDISRPVAHAGAKVMYAEMKLRAPVDDGILRASIYRKFLTTTSTETRSAYAIGPNKKEAPHWHLVEFGHYRYFVTYRDALGNWKTDKSRPLPAPVWVPAVPFIRPTFEARKRDAIEAMRRRAAELLRGGR